jgi:hypothetical protein
MVAAARPVKVTDGLCLQSAASHRWGARPAKRRRAILAEQLAPASQTLLPAQFSCWLGQTAGIQRQVGHSRSYSR